MKSTAEPLKPFASTVLSDGTPLRTGGVVSTTLTSKVAAGDVLPVASLAVQETFVVPIGNVLPDAFGVQVIVGDASTTSLAAMLHDAVAPLVLVASFVIGPLGAEVILGGVLSTTRTSKLAVAGLPDASRAVQMTCVVPIGKVPEPWSQETAGAGSTASWAVGVNENAAPPGPVASRVIVPVGIDVKLGGTESVTLTLKP
jgi:hypothetical protein